MKTCLEVYKLALSYIYEKSTKEYQAFYIPFINLISSECFELNNHLRQSKGLEELIEVPQYQEENEEILYEDKLVLEVFPLGLAAHIAKEDEQSLYNVYIQMYENAKRRIVLETPVILTEVKRVF